MTAPLRDALLTAVCRPSPASNSLMICCPVTVPYWAVLLADIMAIVVVKQLYGGLGKNVFNPALCGVALLYLIPGIMDAWAVPGSRMPVWGKGEVALFPTPLSFLAENSVEELRQVYDLSDLFLGTTGGTLGEVSVMCLLFGFGWLVGRRVIRWILPVGFVGSVALLSFLFPCGNDAVEWMLLQLLSGSVLLCAVFMATDYVTTPVTARGHLIYGVGCGVLTVLLRRFGLYDEGAIHAVLIMNLFSAQIDRFIPQRRFGETAAAVLEERRKKSGTERNTDVAEMGRRLIAALRDNLALRTDPPAWLRGKPLLALTAALTLLALVPWLGVLFA